MTIGTVQTVALGFVAAGLLVADALGQPTRVPFDVRNVSGFWELPADGQNVPRAKLAASVTTAMLDEQAKRDAHAIRWCNYLGMPLLMSASRPLDIRQGQREIIVHTEVNATPRHLYLNRATHINPDEFDPTTNGDSIARWEGDVLVVDTIGFAADKGVTAIPGGGFRTANTHLVERYRLLKNGAVLSVTFTWEDPTVFQTPHSYEFRYQRLSKDYEPRPRLPCDPFDEERTKFLTTPPRSVPPSAARDAMLMNRIGPSKMELFVANADGSSERKLLPDSDFDYNASFAVDGQWIVFTSERTGHGQADIYRVHPDGSALERLTDSPAVDDQAALSPDGKQLAFVSTRDVHTANIWILDLATKKLRNITGGDDVRGVTGKPGGFFRPSWSPDGQWIAVSSDRNTEWRGHEQGAGAGHTQELGIYIIRPDGTGFRRLTQPGITAGSPTWSPDGQRIAFYEIDPASTMPARMPAAGETTAQIVSIDVGTGARTQHTSGPGLKVSPRYVGPSRIGFVVKAAPKSGSVVAGLAYTDGNTNVAGRMRSPSWLANGKTVVYERTDFTARPQNQLLYSWNPEYEYRYTDVFPIFSRDGKLLVTDLSATLGNPQTSLSLMDADGSNRKRVFFDPSGAAMMPSWSPDGEQIVFGFGGFFGARSARPAKLMMIRADGSEPKDLTEGSPNAGFPSWSPDGTRIVYRVWGGDASARGLRLMNLEDRSIKVLSTEWDNFPYWSPSGDRILFTRQRSTDQDFDVYSMRPDGTDLKQLTSSPGSDGHATWTADGQSILFMSSRSGFKDEAALYDNSPQPYAQVYIMRADGSDVRQLTDSRWEDSMPVFVPETKRTTGTR